MAYLVFASRQGEEIGRRPLEGPMVIGRAPDCDVSLSDGKLSRRHCRLMPSAAGWVLSDLGSRHGTSVRGRPISRHVLRDGEAFRIGDLNVIFRAAAMVTGEERQDGLARPKRPASPPESPRQGTAVGFRSDLRPVTGRSLDDFPIPIPTEADVDLSWLNGPAGRSPPGEAALELGAVWEIEADNAEVARHLAARAASSPSKSVNPAGG